MDRAKDFIPGTGETRKSRLLKMYTSLENERSSFISHWRELADYILPRRPRWTTSDRNKGDKRNSKIYDCTATYAARTLRSGMMSGVTSPARPWFRLSVHDFQLMEDPEVVAWLWFVSERMFSVFRKSNLYQNLPIVYGDIGIFGTAAMMVEEDFDKVIHCTTFPIGSYVISSNHKGRIDTFGRKFPLSVRQIVTKFGGPKAPYEIDWTNISMTVQRAWKNGEYETPIDVCHMLYPNPLHEARAASPRLKPYASVYFESGATGVTADGNKFLRDSGYDMFRVLVPRWEVSADESWGNDCPGMTALGDIKQLQSGEKRRGQAIDKMVAPPLVGPSSLRRTVVSGMPGDLTFEDAREGQKGIRPIHEVNPSILALENSQAEIRQRVKTAFFEDLFLMLSQSDRREITAREVDERHEEKLWALGPVLQSLDQDFLAPLIDITFADMLRQGQIPPPPKKLAGSNLNVEYTSVMAVAQKLVGLGNVERFLGFSTQLMGANPEAGDKINFDQAIDVYGEMSGIPPGIIRSDEDVEALRAERNKAIQQQQKMEQMATAASAVKDLSGAAGPAGSEGNILSAALGG